MNCSSFQRKLLETRLVETRKHLEEVKSTWNEKLVSLESQITHLNEKISEDTAEFTSKKNEWMNQRQILEAKVGHLRVPPFRLF